MQSFTTSVTVAGKTLTFHIVDGNYNVNTDTKTVTGTVHSYVSGNIVDNYVSGSVRPAKTSSFVIKNVDLTNGVDAAVSTYLTANLATVLVPVSTPAPGPAPAPGA